MYKIDIKLLITKSRQTLGLSSTDDVFVSEVILTSSSARALVLTDGGTPTHWRDGLVTRRTELRQRGRLGAFLSQQ